MHTVKVDSKHFVHASILHLYIPVQDQCFFSDAMLSMIVISHSMNADFLDTCLLNKVIQNRPGLVSVLLQCGANAYVYGSTILVYAIAGDCCAVTRLLLENCNKYTLNTIRGLKRATENPSILRNLNAYTPHK